LRIAHVTPYFLPVDGGVERHVLNLSKQLVRLGNEVEVFTCKATRNGGTLESFEVIEGIPVHRYASVGGLGEFGKIWPGFGVDLLKGRFDVIHAHSFRHPHTDLSLLVSKLSRSGSVLTTHSPFHPGFVRGPLARALVPVYDEIVAPITLRSFDRIVSLTMGEAVILEGMGATPAQVVVIPHGVEEIHFRATDPAPFIAKYGLGGRIVVLCLARMNRTKGLGILLEAFSRIAPLAPEASLVLAGPSTSKLEEQFRDELVARSRSLGLGDRVVFTGRLSEEEKAAAYEACTAFVLPSIYEPYGIVLLEAAAHGKPLISTRSGGPSSIVTEGVDGLLVEPGNPEQLARALLSIISDAALQKRMGERAREMAREYTWERVAKSTSDAYRSIGGN